MALISDNGIGMANITIWSITNDHSGKSIEWHSLNQLKCWKRFVVKKEIDLDIQKIGGQWQCKELICHLFRYFGRFYLKLINSVHQIASMNRTFEINYWLRRWGSYWAIKWQNDSLNKIIDADLYRYPRS